ncbi:putative glutamine ABC transporter permease protein GlnM [Thalassovita gelatinovora]|uniref:Putative glutamine ABC transporter permease protein GlnM n=1 Tax=Thalassovita gelatinovora TaxID=53501 RepID=A0A0P1FGN4_THAGE|nr:ABC transporter permease subunit [Thalassovita gelatinovora]QIZ81802.1 ABC transporter permease subunit [Thalassovita gelatinovora]CUH67072.1 putative glutamine ABC transporter permease protein GlnM [Thalassovita gelatinovora]SEP81131.1 L-glutamine ABC transporter membrane protein /L-glutamate ABC transporter membrane protein /L-aspartate ABC transporter membrane protein /L-asparagine ABC transporter membrane protein [Thalassovita gelatinovora]
MTTLTDPPKESFRLSMLIYDTRYRSMTIQVVALIGFMLLIGWLVNNTAQNLLDLGKEPSFSFLGEAAGYDINQRLVDYDNQNSHLRASFVGLLNTLLVAVMGCITATILGVIIGVLRLSKNWLISKLMTVYVETFRNVPVLLWIVFTMAILIETLPVPRSFKGVDVGAVVVTNRGIYVPEPLFSRSLGDIHLFGASSFRFDISLDLIAFLIALALGLFVRHKINQRAHRIQEETGIRPTTWYLSLAAVAVPVLVVLVTLGFYLGYPEFKGFNFRGGTHMRNSLIALWLALSLYTAAFIAENVRAGILAISKGQTEAAAALGLRSNRIMSLVILPQALRVIIPPLISQYLNLTKNSSLAIAVGYMDLTGTLMGITLNQTGRELETLLLGMLIYLLISLSISLVMNWYNNRVKLVER